MIYTVKTLDGSTVVVVDQNADYKFVGGTPELFAPYICVFSPEETPRVIVGDFVYTVEGSIIRADRRADV